MSFNDLSTDTDGNIVNWSWDFGDGETSYGNRALKFDGSNDYVEVPNHASLNLNNQIIQ